MSIKKQYLKSKPLCKVTFSLPKEAARSASHVNIVGEFNEWDVHAMPMKKLKNGNFTITINLEAGREYQYRYLIEEKYWENDWCADKYVRAPIGNNDNSVVIV